MNIAIYDAGDPEKETFKDLESAHAITYIDGALQTTNIVAEADAVSIFVSSKLTAEVIAAMPNLKLVACRSTGFNNVDLAACTQRGIVVANVPTYGEHTVAEYTIGLLLSLSRKINQAAAQVHAGQIDNTLLRGDDLYGKTLGVIGTGRIGKNVIKIAKALGMEVIANDLYPDETAASEIGFSYATLEDVLVRADVVSLHAPLTPDNQHIINAERLTMLKPGALLVNTARGELVDTLALVQALHAGKLGGAALDVLENEQLLDTDEEELLFATPDTSSDILRGAVALDVLRKLPNVVLSAHNAYNSRGAIERINTTTRENIAAFVGGSAKNIVGA